MFLYVLIHFVLCPAKPGGRIETQELHTLPLGPNYTVQDKAWMDELVMHEWIDVVLEPYIMSAPDGIVPVLFLDSHRAHMMKRVVSRIQDLGVDVFHIPGGCTGLCQPVDVGFNKPLKTRMREQWNDWMASKWDGMTTTSATPKPTRYIVSEWVVNAFYDFPEDLIKNAWTKTGYAWFDREHFEFEDEDEDLADDDDDDLVLRMDWSNGSDDGSDDTDEMDTDNEDNSNIAI